MKLFLLFSVGSLAVLAAALPSIPEVLEQPATLTLLPEAAFLKGAMCLDGSPAGYYLRPGKDSGSSKWILHLMGGAWCNSTEDCYNRSLTKLGSTHNWTVNMDFHGALSSNVDINPSFYNWNMVFLIYCDGASFGGDREEPVYWNGKKIFYRGYRILTAIMEDLNNNRNLTQATDVVLTGCSAGGMAVYMHMNYIQTLVPATARFSGLPDAGFFIDIQRYNSDDSNSDGAYQMVKFQEMERALMSQCKEDYPDEEIWKCIYAPYIYKYIKAPIMVLNSRYDTAQINGLFDLPCLPPNCSQEEMAYFNFFAESFKEQVGIVTSDAKSSNGFFLDSCLVHCQTLDNHPWTEFKVQGRSMSNAVYDWYYEYHEVKEDDCAYPCNPTCPGPYPPPKSLDSQLVEILFNYHN